jgi:GDP-L-fucose synthase
MPEADASATALFPIAGKRVFVAGHRGLVGSALVRRLAREECETLTVERAALDLRDRAAVAQWFERERPEVTVLAAARVGGVLANSTYPVEFLLDNLLIATAVIEGAHRADVAKLLYLGSSCIYPRLAAQPMSEDALLTGPLEPTNEPYAIAKIAGIKLVQAFRRQYGRDFIAAMPTNLYGPGDNFDPFASHVLPALLRKAAEAKETGGPVTVWGTGTPRREFLYVDDCADACVFLLQHYSGETPINIGSGQDLSILDLTRLVMRVLEYEGPIEHDLSKPDGSPRKLLDVSRINALGWQARTPLEDGIARAYADWRARGGRG